MFDILDIAAIGAVFRTIIYIMEIQGVLVF
jgi:hypothetical protein